MEKIIATLLGLYLNTINLISRRIGGKQSFFIFCYPFKAKISKSKQQFLDTAEQFTLPIDDFKIQGYKWGKGPRNILFVHGWQSNAYRWRDYVESLDKTQFSIYAFDAPGHGNSGSTIGNVPLFAKGVKAMTDHVGTFESIVAHSIGGFGTFYFLHLHPENKINKIVSLASAFDANAFTKQFFDRLHLSSLTKKNFLAYFKEYAGNEITYFRIDNLLDQIKSKGLIIHDQKDEVVPVTYASQFKAIWPDAKLILTEGNGHKLRNPDILKTVCEFVTI